MSVSRYRYQRPPVGAAPTGDMFQWKIHKIFKNLPYVFVTADDILVVGYDTHGKDHDETLWQVLQICRQVNLKLNKDKCHFRCTSVSLFGEMISRHGVQPNPQKLKTLQAFLSIINYLGKFSPSTEEVCESLRKLMSAKTE